MQIFFDFFFYLAANTGHRDMHFLFFISLPAQDTDMQFLFVLFFNISLTTQDTEICSFLFFLFFFLSR